jgi:thioredoxin 1
MLPLIIKIAISAGIGAAVGYYGKCTSGTCPLTSTWWRGAIYGAVLGLLFSMLSIGGGLAMNESTEDVKHITADQFDAEVSQSTLPVVVDFYATWCGPCKTLAPILEQAAGTFVGKVKFVKVNVDESPALAQRFSIESVPNLVFFKAGKVLENMVGMPYAPALEARLRTLAGNSGN